MADDAFRITTVPTVQLCTQLDCAVDVDHLDAALADAGYVRLDHGLRPSTSTAIMACSPPAGLDPGHRAPALAFAHCLLHVVHADGRPEPERLRKAAHLAVATMTTDPVGERIVGALAAYSSSRDPGPRALPTGGAFGVASVILAKAVYDTARHRNVVTDVAIERAQSLGEDVPGWKDDLLSNMRVEEPIVRVRRHDAADYEKAGIEPQLAELIAWIRANPDVGADDFVRYSQMVGVEPRDAARRIENAIMGNARLTDRREG